MINILFNTQKIPFVRQFPNCLNKRDFLENWAKNFSTSTQVSISYNGSTMLIGPAINLHVYPE
jgi:hypothetical protein